MFKRTQYLFYRVRLLKNSFILKHFNSITIVSGTKQVKQDHKLLFAPSWKPNVSLFYVYFVLLFLTINNGQDLYKNQKPIIIEKEEKFNKHCIEKSTLYRGWHLVMSSCRYIGLLFYIAYCNKVVKRLELFSWDEVPWTVYN